MAAITTYSVASSGWTQIDGGISATYADVWNDGDDGVGLRVSGSDPGAGTAWNASGGWRLVGGESHPFALAAGDKLWARKESATGNVTVNQKA